MTGSERQRGETGKNITVQGASGSLLCIGDPKDPWCRPLLFQNYEERVYGPTTAGVFRDLKAGATVKGGFFLPTEFEKAKILCTPGMLVATGRTDPGPPRYVCHMTNTGSLPAQNHLDSL